MHAGIKRRSIGFLVAMMAMADAGCLLLADAPPFVDSCVDEDLGEEVGQVLARGRVSWSRNTYDCPDRGLFESDRDDMVYAWAAPDDGVYQIRIQGELGPRVGVAAPECGGEVEVCVADEDSSSYEDDEGEVVLIREFEAGELVHIVVEQRWGDGDFTLSITPHQGPVPSSGGGSSASSGGGGAPCIYSGDGECDEPGGTGLCAPGTDSVDCACDFQDDGVCDEPSSCPYGSDSADCR